MKPRTQRILLLMGLFAALCLLLHAICALLGIGQPVEALLALAIGLGIGLVFPPQEVFRDDD